MRIISTYAGHESSMSVYVDGKITVIELDKFTGNKYFSLRLCNVVEQSEIIEQALEAAGVENDFDIWINGSFHDNENGTLAEDKLENIINFKRTIRGPGHHMCHAHSSYWQSPFDKAYLMSSDGGGNDGYFNIYTCNRKTGPILQERIDRFDLGTFYGLVACTIPQVGKTTRFFYDAAGKAMALASQIERALDPDLLSAMRSFYANGDKNKLLKYIGMDSKDFYHNLKLTKGNETAKTVENNRLGMMIAMANQKVFEEKFANILFDRQYYVGLQQDNLIITGGCALNVTNNQRLNDLYPETNTFVAPNPTDGGLSLGGLFWYLHLTGIDIPDQDYKFSGIPLIENKKLRKKRKTPIKTIAKMITEGKVLGILEGNAEIGPRALGHRSIIVDPSIRGMKEKINDQVKHREWFRPFAPIVLEEHLDRYFVRKNWENLEHMSYAVEAKPEFERKFNAACHVDGTARVQVCDEKDSTVYKLLKEIGTPLLNTSFNDNGKPIVSNVEDAYNMLEYLDGIVVNGVLITK